MPPLVLKIFKGVIIYLSIIMYFNNEKYWQKGQTMVETAKVQ